MLDDAKILAEGKHLRFVSRRNWEFVERIGITGIVVIVPVTVDGALLFVEQYREPVRASVIEFPAGLVGDEPGQGAESSAMAAARELLEETGYAAASMKYLNRGTTSSGLTSEVVEFFLAEELTQQTVGGGVSTERITVHKVRLAEVPNWLTSMESQGLLVSSLVFAGLHLLHHLSCGKP